MRTSNLLLLAALLCLSTLSSAQPPFNSDTFLLGAVFVTNNGDPQVENHYADVKADMPFNCVFDALKPTQLEAAADAEIWITGGADPGADSLARVYYNGITGLGQWSTAGRYWAADSAYNLFHTQVWHYRAGGIDEQREINGDQVYVRSITGENANAGIILDSLNAGFLPFFHAIHNTITIDDTVVDLHKFYVRLFVRLLESVGQDPVVLTLQADWMDGDGVYHNPGWGDGGEENWAEFRASELYTTQNNGWKLTEPKELYVNNPGGNPWYWRGNLTISWTGERNLEIYYVTISDSIGDKMVFDPSHPYNSAITTAANYAPYQSQYMFRHFMVDEPTWGQIWAGGPACWQAGCI
jgi:hypothetical protein